MTKRFIIRMIKQDFIPEFFSYHQIKHPKSRPVKYKA